MFSWTSFLDGLRTNLRQRGDRWYWHWDSEFIDPASSLPPSEVTEVDRFYAAVHMILGNGIPVLLVRGQMSDLVSQERADAVPDFVARHPNDE